MFIFIQLFTFSLINSLLTVKGMDEKLQVFNLNKKHGDTTTSSTTASLEINLVQNQNASIPILEPCEAYLQLFADAASNFTKCLVINARPFRFCEGCVVHFTKASTIYTDLFSRKDKECHNSLLRADRIQVLTLVYKNMNDVWDNSDCKNCFEKIVEDESGTVNFSLTNDTILFQYFFENVSMCLNITPGDFKSNQKLWNSSDCIRCKDNYSLLNTHYEKIASETSQHVCMDIIDMMNYTRLMWGKKLNCSHRIGNKAPVIGITFIMGMLPVCFYVSNRIFGGETEKSTAQLQEKRLRKPIQDYGTGRNDANNTQNSNYFSSLSS